MDEMKAMLAHGCAFMAVTFTSIVVWRIKRDARVRWECPERDQRQPLFGCRRQRD